MESLCIYIYEIKKGSKPLALVTLDVKNEKCAIEKIRKSGLNYVIQKCGDNKINIFLGTKTFVDVAKTFIKTPLNELSADKDFILGTILGYDCKMQCERYLKNCHNG